MKIVSRVLTILVLVACLLGVGMIFYRFFSMNRIPAQVGRMYFDDVLTAAWNRPEGAPVIYTQEIQNNYDQAVHDSKIKGSFFADELRIIPELGQLQVVVRYNDSTLDRFAEYYGLSETPTAAQNTFTFFLRAAGQADAPEQGTLYPCRVVAFEEKGQQNYLRLLVNGIDFGGRLGEPPRYDENNELIVDEERLAWLRLEIHLTAAPEGQEDPYSRLCVFQNNASRYRLDIYEPEEEEKPDARG